MHMKKALSVPFPIISLLCLRSLPIFSLVSSLPPNTKVSYRSKHRQNMSDPTSLSTPSGLHMTAHLRPYIPDNAGPFPGNAAGRRNIGLSRYGGPREGVGSAGRDRGRRACCGANVTVSTEV